MNDVDNKWLLGQATVSRYAGLQKETSSLQAVFELRCDEVRNLRHELEKVSASAVECSALRERNHTLLNTVEGLQAQLELKVNEDRSDIIHHNQFNTN